MKIKEVLFATCVALAVSACSESNSNAPAQKVVEYLPDPVKVYEHVVSERPVGAPLLLQETYPCFLDQVNNQNAIGINLLSDKSKVRLDGWAGDVPNGKSPQDAWLEFDGIKQDTGFYYIKTTSGPKRQDVVDVFKKPGLADTGWEVFVSLSDVPEGIYEVHIMMLVDDRWLTCDTKRALQL